MQNGSAMKKSCIEKIGKAIVVVPEILQNRIRLYMVYCSRNSTSYEMETHIQECEISICFLITGDFDDRAVGGSSCDNEMFY